MPFFLTKEGKNNAIWAKQNHQEVAYSNKKRELLRSLFLLTFK